MTNIFEWNQALPDALQKQYLYSLLLLIFLPHRTRNQLKEAKRTIATSIPLGTSTSHTDEGPPAKNQITITPEGYVAYNPTSPESVYQGIDNRPIEQGGGNEATITNPDSMYADVDNQVSVQGDSCYAEIPASRINDAYTNESVIKMRTKVNEV
tara:strand:- start:335 stop:796 length:462 start_codon:yes stop_codon:yes gene_type:complete